MRLHLCAVGRLRAGPERALLDDYIQRFDRLGRGLSLGPIAEHEVDDRRGGGMAAEAALLERACPSGAKRVVLDERGTQPSSPDLAALIVRWRDEGCTDLAFCIGGADGLDPSFRQSADHALSLGTMVWPHMLVRVMLTEQLYRAATILAGRPYHRE